MYHLFVFFSYCRVSTEVIIFSIVIYRKETNGRKKERVLTNVRVHSRECQKARIKMILMFDECKRKALKHESFLYDQRRKNYCIKYCIICTHTYRLYETCQTMSILELTFWHGTLHIDIELYWIWERKYRDYFKNSTPHHFPCLNLFFKINIDH